MENAPAMQSLGPARLMQLTEDCVTSFNADQLSLDAHADNFVQANRIESADDETFLRQVLYGTMRYSKLLAAFCAAFYYKNRCHKHSSLSCTLGIDPHCILVHVPPCSGTVLRGDVHLYTIYAYLAALRLKELTWHQFRCDSRVTPCAGCRRNTGSEATPKPVVPATNHVCLTQKQCCQVSHLA